MTIDFEPSDLQRSLRDAVTKICTHFDDDYWLQCDRDGKFPHEFHKELASGGWLGICISEAYGGSGLGITEAAIMMEPIGASSRREIEKMGRKAVDSNLLFIDGLEVPVEDRIGEEGRGFEYILHGMNPERILIAAEAVGLGRVALKRATAYAKERSYSIARSAKIKPSNTRWRNAGWNWKQPVSWFSKPRGNMITA